MVVLEEHREYREIIRSILLILSKKLRSLFRYLCFCFFWNPVVICLTPLSACAKSNHLIELFNTKGIIAFGRSLSVPRPHQPEKKGSFKKSRGDPKNARTDAARCVPTAGCVPIEGSYGEMWQ